MRDILKIERGDRCEICLKPRPDIGVFHILPVGRYPRIRFSFENVLLAGWYCCHQKWHHDFKAAREIDKRIRELRGDDYEMKLAIMDKGAPKMDAIRLRMTHDALLEHLRRLREAGNAE